MQSAMLPSMSRSPERLVFFSDAVVAIALTLLVLPLADAVPEAVAQHVGSMELISENEWKIYSFLLSFVVIARLWVFHHRLFEQVKGYSYPLMVANFCWLLTIVILPFLTEMVGGFHNDLLTAVFYIGAVLASNICQLVMIRIIHADRDVAKNADGVPERQRFMSALNTGILVVALVVAALVSGVEYYAFLLLLLAYPISWIRYRRSPAGSALA
jgi:uncharacterized membrane protein